MPGAYAHITMVNELISGGKLKNLGTPSEAILAAGKYLKFVELGAISPDYPYLVITDANSEKWAEAMHLRHTGALIQEVARRVAELTGVDRQKALAWLLGYVAHVVADVTVHPIVNMKVGPYDDNKTDHRACEMHQDAYIFDRMNLGPIGAAEHLDQGALSCGEEVRGALGRLWSRSLATVHPEQAAAIPPDPSVWHDWMKKVLDQFAEEGQKMIPVARHVAAKFGLVYPLFDEVKRADYIDRLETPKGTWMSYDEVFNRAVDNIGRVWAEVAHAVAERRPIDDGVLGNWSLDTGRDDAGRLVFWEEAGNA